METKLKEVKNQNEVQKMSSIGAVMLPPMFRSRVRLKQRASIMAIVFMIASALGALSFTMTSNVVENFKIVNSQQKDFFLYSLLATTITMLASLSFVTWCRTRAYIIPIHELLVYLVPSFIMTVGLTWISFHNNKSALDFFDYLSYINMSMGIITAGIMLALNFVQRKRFKGAWIRTASTSLPLVLISFATLILARQIKSPNEIPSFSLGPIVIMFLVLFIGLLAFLLACTFTSKYVLAGSKTLWNSIRFNGGLTTILIYATLFVVGAKFSSGFKLSLPIVITIIIDAVILGGFITFTFLAGRMKNIFKTNPLTNQIMLKLFIVLISIIGLIMIEILPTLYEVKSYGNPSYVLLTLTAFVILIGVITAHFNNLIVYSKYFKSVIGGAIATIFIILGIIFMIASLKNGHIIMQIISRKLVITYLTITIFIEATLALANIGYIAINIMKKENEQKTEKAKAKKAGK